MRNTGTLARGRLHYWLACAAFAIAGPQPAFADFQSAYKNYREGKFAEAAAEFMELAQLGDSPSQFNLGVMSVRGEAMEKDAGTGVGWMLASLENGYPGITADKVADFKNSLTPEQKTQAEAIVSKYGKEAIARHALPGRFARTEQCRSFTPARAGQLAKPYYPISALQDQRDGIVVIQATVGVDGLARDPHILVAAPEKVFDNPTIDALLKSRFIPATRNGQAVEAQFVFRLTYSMESGELWNVRAIKKIREAADQGHPSAKYIMGLLGTLDSTLKIPADKAREMILSAAQAGHPQAQYWVADQMRVAQHCGDDTKRKLWLKPAAKGDANAQIELVHMYLENPDSAAVDEIKSLLSAAISADSAYTLKHAVALYAAPPLELLRDSAAAMALVPRLKKHDDSLDPHINEAMAAAYAANGDFKNAVIQQERTIKKADKLYWSTAKMDERLAAYKEKRVLTGDLFAVPPTAEPLPEISNEMEDCRQKKRGCGRHGPDTLKTPTGSHIQR